MPFNPYRLYFPAMATGLDILLWVGAGIWLLFLVQFVINCWAIRELPGGEVHSPARWPSVSIVAPARNEAARIEEAVTSFCTQDYPAVEVIVVDDGSTDQTPEILARLQQRFTNLRVIRGPEPPEGWLGKPHALETGRKHATGQWLLFVDADVVYAPDLLRHALAHVLGHDAAMLFLYPRLTTRQVLEAAIISSLYLIPFAALPGFLVHRKRGWRPAAGGGMFNLVRRDAFEATGAFECLKDAVVDDVGLAIKVRQAGFSQRVALAGPRIRLRMYDGTRATIDGFGKNTYPAMRKRPWSLLIPFVAGTLLSLLPYYGFAAAWVAGSVSVPAAVSLVCMHLVMAGVAWRFRQPWVITLLNPVRELCWWWILLRSAVKFHRDGFTWRGRRYPRE